MKLKTILIVIRVGSVEDETRKVIVPQGSHVLFENAETFEIQREYDNRKRSYFCNKEQRHI